MEVEGSMQYCTDQEHISFPQLPISVPGFHPKTVEALHFGGILCLHDSAWHVALSLGNHCVQFQKFTDLWFPADYFKVLCSHWEPHKSFWLFMWVEIISVWEEPTCWSPWKGGGEPITIVIITLALMTTEDIKCPTQVSPLSTNLALPSMDLFMCPKKQSLH